MNGDLLSLIYIVVFLLYGLVEDPFSPGVFLDIMLYYCVIVISMKFVY